MFGFKHIARSKAGLINDFNREHFNPLNNMHRPSLFGKPVGMTPRSPVVPLNATTPGMPRLRWEKLASLPATSLRHLKAGVTIKALLTEASKQSDLQAAQARNAAWDELVPKLFDKCA